MRRLMYSMSLAAVLLAFAFMLARQGATNRREVTHMQTLLYRYCSVCRTSALRIPVEDHGAAMAHIEQLFDSAHFEAYDSTLRDLVQGLDVWGQRIHFRDSREGRLFVRSVGINGIDEGGRGDDIECEMWRMRP